MYREQSVHITLQGPFYEGDVLKIPHKILWDIPVAVEEPEGTSHFVVLDRVGWFGRRYRLRGVWQEVRELQIPLKHKVEVERWTG